MIIGSSAPTQALRALIKRIAASSATVMVNGESGTGKELVAQSIHHTSARSQRALVPVNCAAIPKDLLESELFGHRKGAFSGAIADRVGRFELANGGTLFLDEIGDMSPASGFASRSSVFSGLSCAPSSSPGDFNVV